MLICIVIELKEEEEIGTRSRHGSGASSSGERMDPPDLPPTMEQTLILILKKLKEKRRECQRPEDIEVTVYFPQRVHFNDVSKHAHFRLSPY